jgi:hypothetical protein
MMLLPYLSACDAGDILVANTARSALQTAGYWRYFAFTLPSLIS